MAVKIAVLTSKIRSICEEEILKHPYTETGGILMGYINSVGHIIVTHASPPGPKAKHFRNSITFDVDFCQSFIDRVYFESGGAYTYVGDWHCHKSDEIEPSPIDHDTLKRESLNSESRIEYPIIIIIGSKRHFFSKEVGIVGIKGYYFDRISQSLIEVSIQYQEGCAKEYSVSF